MTISLHSYPNITLERKEGARCQSLTARSVVPLFLTHNCMTITRYRIIPQVSDEGTTRIPFEAFADIQAIVEGIWRRPNGTMQRERSRSYATTVDAAVVARVASDLDTLLRTTFRQIASFIQATPTTATVF